MNRNGIIHCHPIYGPDQIKAILLCVIYPLLEASGNEQKKSLIHCRPIYGLDQIKAILLCVIYPLLEASGDEQKKLISLPSHLWDGLNKKCNRL